MCNYLQFVTQSSDITGKLLDHDITIINSDDKLIFGNIMAHYATVWHVTHTYNGGATMRPGERRGGAGGAYIVCLGRPSF